MKTSLKLLLLLAISTAVFSCKTNSDRLGKATREKKNGWIYLPLAGAPADVGYQHGYLAANEIDTLIKVLQYYLPSNSGKDWAFYRGAAQRFLWKKIDKEYQDEIKGIAEGLQAKGFKYDSLDIATLNANIELTEYWWPSVQNAQKAHTADNKAPGRCSAFIATGS